MKDMLGGTGLYMQLSGVPVMQLEIRNAVDYLSGARRDSRLDRVTMALGAVQLSR